MPVKVNENDCRLTRARTNEDRVKSIKESLYDLKATHPNAPDMSDQRTRAELLAIIREAQAEIAERLGELGSNSKNA